MVTIFIFDGVTLQTSHRPKNPNVNKDADTYNGKVTGKNVTGTVKILRNGSDKPSQHAVSFLLRGKVI